MRINVIYSFLLDRIIKTQFKASQPSQQIGYVIRAYLIICTFGFFYNSALSQEKDIQVNLTRTSGVLFASVYNYPTEVPLSEIKKMKIIGIPKFLRNYKIYKFELETRRKESREKSIKKNCIYFLSGLIDDKKIIISDSNNNLDFADDKIFEIDLTEKSKISEEVLILNFFPAEERIESIIPKEKIVKLIPVTKKSEYSIAITNYEYRQGFFSINEKKYNLALELFNNQTENAKIIIEEAGQRFKQKYEADEFYRIGDVVYFNNFKYLLEKVEVHGASLYLKYIGQATKKFGYKEGMYLTEDINFKPLNRTTFNLTDYSGKFIMLDFWGTWCRPCLEKIPELKSIRKKYKDKNFELISIAADPENDPEELRDFIHSNKMEWIHLIDHYEPSGPIKKLNIVYFPTALLISPEGKILIRENDPSTSYESILEKFLN